MDISKLTKRQRVAILSFRTLRRSTSVPWMPKTMEGLSELGFTSLDFDWSGANYRLTDAGREALAKIIEEERGGKA